MGSRGESIWAFPTILTLHTFGLGLLVGANTIVDLRLLGIGRRVPLEPLRPLFSVMWAGFWLNAVTGSLLFAADATRRARRLFFLMKLVFVAIGVATMVAIKRSRVRRAAGRADRLAEAPRVRVAGCLDGGDHGRTSARLRLKDEQMFFGHQHSAPPSPAQPRADGRHRRRAWAAAARPGPTQRPSGARQPRSAVLRCAADAAGLSDGGRRRGGHRRVARRVGRGDQGARDGGAAGASYGCRSRGSSRGSVSGRAAASRVSRADDAARPAAVGDDDGHDGARGDDRRRDSPSRNRRDRERRCAPSGWLTSAPFGTSSRTSRGCGRQPRRCTFSACRLVFGVLLVVNLRILGAMKGLSFAPMHRLLPWGILGLGMNLITGMMFFIAAPNSTRTTSPSTGRSRFLLLAGAHFLYLTVFSKTWGLKIGRRGGAARQARRGDGYRPVGGRHLLGPHAAVHRQCVLNGLRIDCRRRSSVVGAGGDRCPRRPRLRPADAPSRAGPTGRAEAMGDYLV